MGDEKPKLEWMYASGKDLINREDYLLGKKIDKTFELADQGGLSQAELEKDCLPSSIFASGSGFVNPIDLERKQKEDPLEMIRQKEIEFRKQLLKNPVKLKKLKAIIAKQSQGSKSGSPTKSKKKKKKKHKEDIDKLLAEKYMKVMKEYGADKLKNLGRDDSSSSSSESSSEEESRRRRSRSRSPSHRRDRRDHTRDDRKKRVSFDRDRRRHESRRSRSPQPQRSEGHKPFGLVVPKGAVQYDKTKHTRDESTSSSKEKPESKYQKPPPRTKLSAEEIEKKRLEMMANAKWRDDLRTQNVKKYKEDEIREKAKETQFDPSDFAKKQLSLAAATSSVESRIKSNIYHIQRSKSSMDSNFARR